ncbi:hypothetical protein GX50_01040 [[Emmonsia] crescens]|uniref:Uncharacterized protein n=1 Tax=[Emmonsia] crescens TaxID=73230 RepID=A0A2B7ZI76_9EURO|nr:hypothetical protein GX50_01040 [Emmonsia crescens]
MSGRVKRLMYLHGAVWFGARVGRACSPERRELADLVNQVNPDTKWSWRRRGHGDIQRMGRLALFINPGCSKTEEFRKNRKCNEAVPVLKEKLYKRLECVSIDKTFKMLPSQ